MPAEPDFAAIKTFLLVLVSRNQNITTSKGSATNCFMFVPISPLESGIFRTLLTPSPPPSPALVCFLLMFVGRAMPLHYTCSSCMTTPVTPMCMVCYLPHQARVISLLHCARSFHPVALALLYRTARTKHICTDTAGIALCLGSDDGFIRTLAKLGRSVNFDLPNQ